LPILVLATLWKRTANGPVERFRTVVTGDHTQPQLTEERMTPINEHSLRIAYCECGARLAGSNEDELFEAAQAHLAHHHPQLLGAVGLDVVQQMAEERPGALNA
jgi:hypothetical protein